MATKIYLIRHGESVANQEDVFLGHTDLDLTEKGRRQAEKTAVFLKEIPVDVIYSSDLKRAYHTALATAEAKGLPVITDRELREIYAGDWENKSFKELMEEFCESFDLWIENIGSAYCDNGETVKELQKRFVNAVERIAKENDGKTVLIFTHATPVRVFGAYAAGLQEERMKEIPWPGNASVTSAEYESGRFKLIWYSRNDFLGEIATELPDKAEYTDRREEEK